MRPASSRPRSSGSRRWTRPSGGSRSSRPWRIRTSRARSRTGSSRTQNQPDLPAAELVAPSDGDPATVTFEDGTYLAYLDAWLRPITVLEDPELLEPALGGLDTTTRTRTVGQVRLKHLGAAIIDDCDAIEPLPDLFAGSTEAGDRPPSTGRLAARARPVDEATDICEIPADARYQGLENQLYRVEVHDPGELGTATFNWSRENASIAVLWTGQTADRLAVSSLGRDAVLGFASDQLIELVDDTLELHGRPGTLVSVVAPPVDDELTVDPSVPIDRADFPRNPKVRRWDNPEVARVALGSGDGWLALENGVEVRFGAGFYNTGDHWLIPARTATREVEWPRDPLGRAVPRPPDGIAHHYAPLALVEVVGGLATAIHDCRTPFPSLTTISADDVSFDNDACVLPGARTVQDALDVLCESDTLRRHKKHLHGWGIVCGMRVVCGPDHDAGPRRAVTVETGYSIDCEGNDVILDRDQPLDVRRLMERAGPIDQFLTDGRGDLSLYMTNDPERGIEYGVEPYDPHWDKRPNPMAGALWNDVYEDCIKPIQSFFVDQLGSNDIEQQGLLAQRRSILASILAQLVNPKATQTLYVAEREHEIMRTFYEDLRALLQSETFCAMFDDASPFPDYPPDMPPMDTIFGLGHHQRIRMRPGGREVWTVGGGINPIRPSSYVNRYDLEGRALLERLAPIAGTSVGADEPDASAGAIMDVAFSPDGSRVYVIAPTMNGDNTFFRAGKVQKEGVAWGELVTICDVHLVTLATSPADPKVVYAVGSRQGIYRIDPDAVDPSMPPTLAFPASGHLVLTAAGRGYATAVAAGATDAAPRYTRVVAFTTAAPAAIALDIPVTAGSDDIAVAESRTRGRGRLRVAADTLYAVAGPAGTGARQVLAFDGATGEPRGGGAAIDVGDGPVRLQPFAPTGTVLVVSEDDCLVGLIDVDRNELVADAVLPVQVGPVSATASDDPPAAYVLNYWSDTITVLPAEVLRPGYRFPLEALATYRRAIVLAFRDLLAGFLQYLKDCLCDHLLVACPVCLGDERIYLASISIRADGVYKVCNFSRRRYVKSFPTIDYWLSVVPIMPFIQKAVEEFCCYVLPDLFGRQQPPTYDPAAEPAAPRYRYSTARTDVELAQRADIVGKFHDARTRVGLAGRVVADAGLRTIERGTADPAFRIGNVVGRPADSIAADFVDRGMIVRRGGDPLDDLGSVLGNVLGSLRTPQAGDDVTLYEREGRVSYFSVASARPAAPARDAELVELRSQVEELRATLQAAVPADAARVAAMESELRDLRGLRDQVSRLLENRADAAADAPATAPATARTTAKGATAAKPKAPAPKSRRNTRRTP